ncbi:HlyD family secretion protein [Croceibacterium aestuarii]|uniref:HlyD family secretion protein n=1 Tax=Croceibacterium aestuarii TaxID=3064139 RepID=UPI00272E1354|nr:HlyD family secretion protein [Croceibacterium sp. D39]
MAEADPSIVETETEAPPAEKRRWGRLALMISVPLLLVIGAVIYWQGMQGKVSTDNAYIQQNMVSVSAEVGGKIVEVNTAENHHVNAGDLLFRIDPSTYELQVQQANAAIANAQANVTALSNSADLSGADIAAAREDIAFAQSRFARQKQLMEKGFTTKADYDAAQHAVEQAREELRQAQARQAAAKAQLAEGSAVPGENPQIAAAKAQKASAELALQRTEVRAPASGRVAEADRLQVGNQLLPNLPVLTIVQDGSTYVEANFKETDLDEMRVGQPAKLKFDAYPGLELKGHVASIGAGTGSEFSVLPAQNASGNWVKVTQRVPVRIAVDEKSPRPLLAGLSTHVTVYTSGEK